MTKPPAFQFYARDFLTGTMDLTLPEVGAYIRLLAYAWDNGPLPLQDARRARIIGCSSRTFRQIWIALQDKWTETPDGYINERLERQRAESAEFRKAQADKGIAGARKRWKHSRSHSRGHSSGHRPANAPAIAEGMPDAWPDDSSPICDLQSADPLTKNVKGGEAADAAPAPDALMDAWNTLTDDPIPRCLKLSASRRTQARARLRDRDLDGWRDVIRRIAASAFCRGENDRGWVATFDWLLKPDTALKVLEGKYDGRARSGPPRATGARTDSTMAEARAYLEAEARKLA